ncbi:hypothetical protein BKA70DRAFT_1571500 [Coprinopsis sp. MPI-PUGE-AT-0042]|nr:hypothetical protein BKA70DRAFT_1571500 [Coprinopsis sp. MPI-PUGE-AT-0042]
MSTDNNEDQESALVTFASPLAGRNDATLHISRGNFNNVEGSQYNILNLIGDVYLTDQRYTSGPTIASAHGSAPAEKFGKQCRHPSSSNQMVSLSPRESPGIPSAQSFGSSFLSAQFFLAESNLRSINQLANRLDQARIFKHIAPFLANFGTLIRFASTAYNACRGETTIGKVIKASIEHRLILSNKTLEELHDRIGCLLCSSVHCGAQSDNLLESQNCAGNEPEVTIIQASIAKEVTAIGEWLHCLQLFWWASSQLLLTESTFTMAALEEFLRSGPVTMLYMICVEEIVFLEPLQGERRSIPVRFINSFEEVHMAVQMACHDTAASQFIASGSYQLDDPVTNTTVDKRDILNSIAKCKEYEVTIFLSKLEVPPDDPQCKTKFNGYVLQATPAATVGEEEKHSEQKLVDSRGIEPKPDNRTYSERDTSRKVGYVQFLRREEEDEDEDEDEDEFDDDASDHFDPQIGADSGHGSANMQMAKLFRRIKFEIGMTPARLESPTDFFSSFISPTLNKLTKSATQPTAFKIEMHNPVVIPSFRNSRGPRLRSSFPDVRFRRAKAEHPLAAMIMVPTMVAAAPVSGTWYWKQPGSPSDPVAHTLPKSSAALWE